MSCFTNYTCDGCGVTQGSMEGWFSLTKYISPKAIEVPAYMAQSHACSTECLDIATEKIVKDAGRMVRENQRGAGATERARARSDASKVADETHPQMHLRARPPGSVAQGRADFGSVEKGGTTMIPKKSAFLFLLGHAPIVNVYLRTGGATLPAFLHRQPATMLQFGLNMPKPIDDLIADDVGISATLSIGGEPHLVVVPWECVFSIGVDEECGFAWEVVEHTIAAQADAAQAEEKPSRGGLRSV